MQASWKEWHSWVRRAVGGVQEQSAGTVHIGHGTSLGARMGVHERIKGKG